jgi:hypothetical protein
LEEAAGVLVGLLVPESSDILFPNRMRIKPG